MPDSTTQLSWSGAGGHWTLHVLPTSSVAAVRDISVKCIEAHAAQKTAWRELTAARREADGVARETNRAAFQAGSDGKVPDKKALKKKKLAAIERVEDAELDFTAATAALGALRMSYLETLAHHAPALAAEARSDAEAGILELASALGIARQAGAKVASSTALLAALPRVVGGDDFAPVPPAASKNSADEFGEGRAPEVHAQIAADRLVKAIGFAKRVLDDLDAAEKEQTARSRLEAEADEAPDLDDDDEGDDGDEES
ncbi:hypothetical protein [Microbacterium sp. ABRD28]|uniref:hypothetical protein n=1 Tax=Microbacterium sp. ABRD28 TaxID=2268461 RepID=UPI000F55228A|nr:hypothetical protein [Microbacterium sp. ABRD28]AZC14567.1 hypothetical protein DT073_13375 [Microbacterium sp. ABRD28]